MTRNAILQFSTCDLCRRFAIDAKSRDLTKESHLCMRNMPWHEDISKFFILHEYLFGIISFPSDILRTAGSWRISIFFAAKKSLETVKLHANAIFRLGSSARRLCMR